MVKQQFILAEGSPGSHGGFKIVHFHVASVIISNPSVQVMWQKHGCKPLMTGNREPPTYEKKGDLVMTGGGGLSLDRSLLIARTYASPFRSQKPIKPTTNFGLINVDQF